MDGNSVIRRSSSRLAVEVAFRSYIVKINLQALFLCDPSFPNFGSDLFNLGAGFRPIQVHGSSPKLSRHNCIQLIDAGFLESITGQKLPKVLGYSHYPVELRRCFRVVVYWRHQNTEVVNFSLFDGLRPLSGCQLPTGTVFIDYNVPH